MSTIKLIAGVVVGTILTVTLLIPVIMDYSDGENDSIYAFVIMGQSNAAYNNNVDVSVVNSDGDLTVQPANVSYFFGYNQTSPIKYNANHNLLKTAGLFPITDGTHFLIGGYEAPFSSIFYEKTGQKCMIINVGWDGQSVEMFQPGNEGYAYANDAVTEAISQATGMGFNVKYGGILWSQGEANRLDSVDDYEKWFTNVWKGVQKWGFDSLLISQTRSGQGGNASIAQEDLAQKIDGVYMATQVSNTFTIENGLMQTDNMHYTQAGRIIIAEDWADYYIDNLYEAPAESNGAIDNLFGAIPYIIIAAMIIACAGIAIKMKME